MSENMPEPTLRPLLEKFKYSGDSSEHTNKRKSRRVQPSQIGKNTASTKDGHARDTAHARESAHTRDSAQAEQPPPPTVPDHLAPGMRIMTCGINPGLTSAAHKQHYAFRGNHFWKCLFLSGLIPVPLQPRDGPILPTQYGIGLTNLVHRPTANMSHLSAHEMSLGAREFLQKVAHYMPPLVIIVGSGIAQSILAFLVSAGLVPTHAKSTVGLQPYVLTHDGRSVYFWAVTSTSPRVAAYSLDRKVQQWKDARLFLEAVEGRGAVGDRDPDMSPDIPPDITPVSYDALLHA